MSNDTVKSKSETKTKSKPLAPKPKSPTKGAFEKTIFSIDPIELEMVEPKSFGVETIEIGKASGRYQVLFIYPKDNTSGCTQEAQDFSALKPQFDALKIDLLGVSKDSLKMHVKFIQTQALTINLISDPDTLLINALGSWVEKSLYGRAYMGADRSTFIIDPQGQIIGTWRQVKVADHAATVLAQIRSLLA